MFLDFYQEDPSTLPISEANLQKTLAEYEKYPSKGEIIIFEEGGEVAGYAILMFYWSNEYANNIVNIDEFYVKSLYRGKGVGTTFMTYLFTDYSEDATVFELEVTPKNKRALAYYQKLGFTHYKNAQLQKIVLKD